MLTPTWRLLLCTLLICALILELGQCQQETPEVRTTSGKKPKTVKPKGPRAKVKATPPTQSLLTQVLRKGRFQRLGESLSVRAGDPLELSTGADTGEYTCYRMYCEDTDCRRDYDRAVKVFVFIAGIR
ncbi:hypothetical protein CRUP_007954 [Coryphaenoides rupestris]|nr:hypothetical protein CRUP_007954 [Coryphaenoides rupestris]